MQNAPLNGSLHIQISYSKRLNYIWSSNAELSGFSANRTSKSCKSLISILCLSLASDSDIHNSTSPHHLHVWSHRPFDLQWRRPTPALDCTSTPVWDTHTVVSAFFTRVYVQVCLCVCWTMADGMFTHSHYIGIMLLLAPSGRLRFLYLTHTQTLYSIINNSWSVWLWQCHSIKHTKALFLENDYQIILLTTICQTQFHKQRDSVVLCPLSLSFSVKMHITKLHLYKESWISV